jgi:branched-chain amino acid transport system ATP-binding protein
VSADTAGNGPRPVLELKGLSKSFGGLHAVRGVTFKIMPGDRKAIIGPNGAGKTTLFNLIT